MYVKLTDTLSLAREQFPGKRNSLDALCERFGVDNAQRSLHGALLDARLLADVYLAMTRGQESLTIDIAQPVVVAAGAAQLDWAGRPRLPLIVMLPTDDEIAAHHAYLESLDRESKGRCLWLDAGSRRRGLVSVDESRFRCASRRRCCSHVRQDDFRDSAIANRGLTLSDPTVSRECHPLKRQFGTRRPASPPLMRRVRGAPVPCSLTLPMR